MFYDDPRVMYFSAHMYCNGGFYPSTKEAGPDFVGTGAGAGESKHLP